MADSRDSLAAEPNTSAGAQEVGAELVSLVFLRAAGIAFLAGFLSYHRWLGRVGTNAQLDGALTTWQLGYDGSDLREAPGQKITLESVLLAC